MGIMDGFMGGLQTGGKAIVNGFSNVIMSTLTAGQVERNSMNKYLIVDGMLHGTGIRDAIEGDYIPLELLHISDTLKKRIEIWLLQYETEHYAGYVHEDIMKCLDKEGISIAAVIQNVFPDYKIEYYSDALCRRLSIKETNENISTTN
jgi:hypothetical protein